MHGTEGSLLKPTHVKARLKFANDNLDDPEESLEKVMWSDANKGYCTKYYIDFLQGDNPSAGC